MNSEFDKVCHNFKCEWSSGRKAKLTLECHAGHDLSLLELSLGRAPGHSEAGAKSRTRPPSYARRQETKKASKPAATMLTMPRRKLSRQAQLFKLYKMLQKRPLPKMLRWIQLLLKQL